MRVGDLLSVISENCFVTIWRDVEAVSAYDGKESIDEKYNDEIVKEVWCGLGTINIEI